MRAERFQWRALRRIFPRWSAKWSAEEVARTGILSLLAVPLHIGGKLACVLSTSSFRKYRGWTVDDEEQLKVVGNVIANAFYRKRAETELQKRLAQIEELKTRLEGENVVLREEVRAAQSFDEIVGRSKALSDILACVTQVARSIRPSCSSERPERARSCWPTQSTEEAPGGFIRS